MEVHKCVIEDTIYISYNGIRNLNLKLFPYKKMKIVQSLKEFGYDGKILKALYTTKKRDELYFPKSNLEENKHAVILLVKTEFEKAYNEYFEKYPAKIKYVKINVKGEYIKGKTTELSIIPQRIELEEDEYLKFDENYKKIKIYGKRTFDGMFFSSKDFSEVFGLKNIASTLTDIDGTYEYGIHYKKFYINKDKQKVCILLTFEGTLKILFAKNTSNNTPYLRWVCETLFIVQHGIEDDKNELIAEMLGISQKHLKQIFNIFANKLPCIYIIKLGQKAELDGIFDLSKYPDNSTVYKFGCTEDLNARFAQHKNKYKKLGILDIHLITVGHIDPINIFKAETELKQIFSANHLRLEHSEHKELVVIENKHLSVYVNLCKDISEKYIGHSKELQKIIADKDNEITITKNDKINTEKLLNICYDRISEQSDRIDEQKTQISELKEELKECKLDLKLRENENRELRKKLAQYELDTKKRNTKN